jgi:hypothetical protein
MMRMEVWSSAFTRSGGFLCHYRLPKGGIPISQMESFSLSHPDYGSHACADSLGEFVTKDKGLPPTTNNGIFLYRPFNPNETARRQRRKVFPPENQVLAISPGNRFRGRSLHQPPVMDGLGNGPLQTKFSQPIRKKLETTK